MEGSAGEHWSASGTLQIPLEVAAGEYWFARARVAVATITKILPLSEAPIRTPIPVTDNGAEVSRSTPWSKWFRELCGQFGEFGKWIDIPFDAADFTAATGTWTVDAGDVMYFRYARIGKTVFINFRITTSTTSNPTASLIIKIPAGLKSVGASMGFLWAYHGGAWNGGGTANLPANSSLIYLYLHQMANWPAEVNTIGLGGQIFFECQ